MSHFEYDFRSLPQPEVSVRDIMASADHSTAQLDGNWDLDNFSNDQYSSSVDVVHICALRNELNEGDEEGNPPTNHWTLCLELSESASVMLDMAPGYGSNGRRGKIEVTSLPSRYTDETLRAVSFASVRKVTVRDAMCLMMQNGRQAFTFAPEWEGCRYWLSVVAEDLEEANIISEGSSLTIKNALLQYWRNPEGSEPRIMREGKFRRAA